MNSASRCKGDKKLLRHQVVGLCGLAEGNKRLGVRIQFTFCDKMEGAHDGKIATSHILHCRHLAICFEEFDGRAPGGFVCRCTHRDKAHCMRIARHGLDPLLVVANDEVCFDFAGSQAEVGFKYFERGTAFVTAVIGARSPPTSSQRVNRPV